MKLARFSRRLLRKAPNLWMLWRWHVYNSRVGLPLGSADYTRFIIIGTARTGSNFLRSLLNDHPQVVAFGELFRERDAIGWDFSGVPRSSAVHTLFQTDPVRFLTTRVFGRYPRHIGAVGFKIFYYHAQDDAAWADVWPHLIADTGIKVIHIKRQNMLRTHLSRMRAMQTDVWVQQNQNTAPNIGPITLDYAACLEEFRQTEAYEASFDTQLANHPLLELNYETLADDHDATMRRVFAFLDVPYRPVRPGTVKQSSRRPLSAAIANYAALQAQFAGTRWARFFDEDVAEMPGADPRE